MCALKEPALQKSHPSTQPTPKGPAPAYARLTTRTDTPSVHHAKKGVLGPRRSRLPAHWPDEVAPVPAVVDPAAQLRQLLPDRYWPLGHVGRHSGANEPAVHTVD